MVPAGGYAVLGTRVAWDLAATPSAMADAASLTTEGTHAGNTPVPIGRIPGHRVPEEQYRHPSARWAGALAPGAVPPGADEASRRPADWQDRRG